jgi:uncharacterized protein YukE
VLWLDLRFSTFNALRFYPSHLQAMANHLSYERIHEWTLSMALKSKFFRVAKAGKTADGREITPKQIEQMAANYSIEKFGARIWLEHFRGLFPGGGLDALGDVLELKVEKDGDETYLLASLSPTDKLIKMNQDRQKVFTSIEMYPNFADTGEAYFGGLAVTDSPSSLGTEMLRFSTAHRQTVEAFKALPDAILSDGLEAVDFNFEEKSEEPKSDWMQRFKSIISKDKGDAAQRFNALENGMIEMAQTFANDSEARSVQLSTMTQKVESLSRILDELTTKLSNTPAAEQPPRPTADGLGDNTQTDC